MAVINDPRLTFKGVSKLTGANYFQMFLVKRGLGRMFATDHKAICQHLDYLAFDIDLSLANPGDHTLLRRVLLNKMLVFNKLFPVTDAVYKQIYNFTKGKRKRTWDLPFALIFNELKYLSYFIRTT